MHLYQIELLRVSSISRVWWKSRKQVI